MCASEPLCLAGDSVPINSAGGCVFGESPLVLDQDGAHDARVIGATQFGVVVRDDIESIVSVEQGKNGSGKGAIWEVFVRAIGAVFDCIGEELELIDKVWVFGGVDLGELGFPHWQFVEELFNHSGCDQRCTTVDELGDLRHERSVSCFPAWATRNEWLLARRARA